MERRSFLTTGAVSAAAATTLAAPAIGQNRIVWRMVTPWPRNTPGVGVNAQRFADDVTAMSNGRLSIQLFAAGELVPPFECLDAVQNGTAELAHATPYYWVGKAPALNYFTGVPFGLLASELSAWLYFGGGMDLWQRVYEPFNVVPFYAGNSGTQAGGWFRREINGLEDLRGLKFRIAGLGGQVLQRLGATTVQLPPGEIAPALASGAIDAAEWIGPWNDLAFGLYNTTEFYYLPAFHEPGPGLEIIVNRDLWNALPADLQTIVRVAAKATAGESFADFTYHNIVSLDPLVEQHNVQLRDWPDDIVAAMGREAWQVLDELGNSGDELLKEVHERFTAFLDQADRYNRRFAQRMLAMRAIARDAA